MVNQVMKKSIDFISKKDLYEMILWREKFYEIRISSIFISKQLQNILGIGGGGYGDKFIKMGVWFLLIPLLGVSDAIGGTLIGLGLFLKALTNRRYQVKRIGSDLKFSIEFVKRIGREIRLI